MRKVEALRLQKQDINFKERTILVRSAKNHKERLIIIDLKLTIILYFYCLHLTDDDLLFNISYVEVSNEFNRIMKNAKIKKITIHDIRHIYASFLLSKLKNSANSILVVQQQLRTF